MNKKRILHIAAMTALAVFIFLGLASTKSTPSVVADEDGGIVVTSETTSRGVVYQIPPPGLRPYVTIGLVFASSETKYGEDGKEISSQESVITKLLREAQKVGGEDIFNLRVDENVTYTKYTDTITSSSGTRTVDVVIRTVTYTGSALAIRYLNN